jgi:hypothetical protein
MAISRLVYRKDFKGVALKVNEELSRRVQEIVFSKGGKWSNGENKIQCTNEEYIVISADWTIHYVDKCDYVEEEYYPKGSAIDFIISNGEQIQLPQFGELVEFSMDNKTWVQAEYKCYIPDNIVKPYMTMDGNCLEFCRQIKKGN